MRGDYISLRELAIGRLTLKRTASRPTGTVRLHRHHTRAAMRWRDELVPSPFKPQFNGVVIEISEEEDSVECRLKLMPTCFLRNFRKRRFVEAVSYNQQPHLMARLPV